MAQQQYDTVSKTAIRRDPQDWAQFGLGNQNVEVIQILDTEQPTIETNRTDSLIHANINGKEGIVHIEIQTHDSRQTPMPFRMAGYIGRSIETFQLPVYSHVIYLHPRAGRRDPGEYVQDLGGYAVRIPYKVIRLYDLEGVSFLERGVKGLLPFTPLMRRPVGMSRELWLERCIEVSSEVWRSSGLGSGYLIDLAILSGLVYDSSLILGMIREVDMRESSVIQHFLRQGVQQGIEQGVQQGIEQGVEQGIQRGSRESIIEGILESLEVRFGESELSGIVGVLMAIEDLSRLKTLRREAMVVSSLRDFAQALELTESSNGSE